MKKIVLLSVLLLSTLLFAEEDFYQDDISAKEAYAMIKKDGALLIDVRSPSEFLYAGHAPGAINIPVFFVRIDLPPLKTRIQVAALEAKKEKAVHVDKIYMPIMDENKKFISQVKKVIKGNTQKTLIIMCRSGGRSRYAANKLAKNGFDNVYNVEDGYIFGWKADKLPGGGQ